MRDLNHNILFWNKGAERIYGWSAEEAIGKNAQTDAQRTVATVRGCSEDRYRKRRVERRNASNPPRWQSNCRREPLDSGARRKWEPKSILVINTDITEKKRMEAQFLRAQRMESIGTLAGGIAHDLNNVLSPILMAIDMLQMKATDETSRKWFEVLRTNAERGGDMVRQVLSFARGVEGERVALQPKHVSRRSSRSSARHCRSLSRSIYRLVNDLWIISADATQMHQVLMNLCVNARDAMPDGGQFPSQLRML